MLAIEKYHKSKGGNLYKINKLKQIWNGLV